MAKLEDLVLYESANSAISFREQAYAPADAARFLRDAIALANADVAGPRFLFIGVRDVAGGERTLPGISAEASSAMRRTLPALLARAVEPPLKIELKSLKIRDARVTMLCISDCDDAPYLLRRRVAGLPAGIGWIRRGTQQTQLTRSDLQRLFAQRLASSTPGVDVEIAFAGEPPRHELELPVLPIEQLPSAAAAGRVHKMLEAKTTAKEVLGTMETRMSRLLHAKIFGIDQPYESHSDESLRLMIGASKDEHAAADRHYELAVRAHKLELVARNRSDVALESVVLRLRLPNLTGIGVADRLYAPAGVDAEAAAAYPLVRVGKRVIDIEADIGPLAAGETVAVFREPPRLWLREAAAGKSIAIDYTLNARELREPIRDSLVIRIVQAAGAKPRAGRNRDRARA
jgi:hypothetical protein